jgi:hypothetical protein
MVKINQGRFQPQKLTIMAEALASKTCYWMQARKAIDRQSFL